MPIKNIMGVVEYDGTDFEGFQIQPEGHRTVQGEITRTLEQILGHPVKVDGASRTDAGVHATGQVIAFKTSASRTLDNIISGTNSLSPGDWRVDKMAEVSWDFHPRHHATGKTYLYMIDRSNSVLRRRYTWGITNEVVVSMMRTGGDILTGEHDFKSFTTLSAHEKDVTVRRIDEIVISEIDEMITIEVTGSGFLYQMVRRIVSVLMAIAKGEISENDIRGLLSNPEFDGSGSAAPAKGLILKKVIYKG